MLVTRGGGSGGGSGVLRTAARPAPRRGLPGLHQCRTSRLEPVVISLLHRRGDAQVARWKADDAPAELEAAADGSSSQQEEADPFVVAAVRLEELLKGCTWGDRAQLVASEFASYAPDMKLALVFNFGCFVTALAFATSWLCGEDPLGGATLTGRSLDAAAAGAACGLPLLLCSALSRTRWARREAPVMALLHDAQAEALAPVLRGLNFPQTLALTALAVLPCLLLLLPAFHAVCVTTAAFVQQHLEASAHVRLQVPLGWRHEVTAAGTALVSGTFAAYHAAAALTVRESQKSAIRSAVLSSDRYWAFRASFERGGGGSSAVAGAAADNSSSALAAADSSSHGGGGGSKPVLGTTAVFSCNEAEGLSAGDSSSSEAAALRTTAAFKTLSVLWLILRTKSAQLGYILTFTNVAYYCLIWDAAGDLAAPAAAALVATAGEAFFVKTSLDLLE